MDITKKYSAELNMINMHLTDLERGHIYEFIISTASTDSAPIGDLLYKLENDESSVTQKVAEATKNI